MNLDLSNLIYTTHAGGKLNTQVWNKINFNYKNLGIKFQFQKMPKIFYLKKVLILNMGQDHLIELFKNTLKI